MRKDLFVLAVLGFAAVPALAAPQCTPHTTRGFWAATCDGYLSPAPAAALQPARLLATCTSSRTAFWDCEGTVNLGGQILAQELHGQAINNENCTGTITYAQTIFGQPAPDLNIRFVVLDQGDTIKGLPIDPGQVLSCVLNRISKDEVH
jgi:hypothetical protein